MSSLVKQSISGCVRASVVLPLAAPLVYAVTSPRSLSVIDLFFFIPIGRMRSKTMQLTLVPRAADG